MLLLPTFLIFVSLSVAAIPLGPRANGQIPQIAGLPSIIPAGLTNALPTDPTKLFKSLPIISKRSLLRRFIMGADYASSSGPFLRKSSHKRQGPLFGSLSPSTLSANDLKEQIAPNSSPGSTPT